MSGMASESGLTELRRGVLGPCVLALLELQPRFGLELVRELSAADGLLTSDGTVYPLLNRLRDAGLVTSEWQDNEGERARRYYSITPAGEQSLAGFRSDWDQFSATVGGVLNHTLRPGRAAPAPDSAPAAAVTAPGTKGRRNDRHHH
jgi:PadR family transcriptional regulator PadR